MTLAVPRLHQVETWRRRESRNGVSLAGLAPGRNGSVGLYQVPPLGSPVPPSQCQLSSPILHATPQVLARSPGSPRGVSRRPGGAVTARPSEPRKGTPPPTSRPSFPRGRCPLSGAEMPYGRCRYPAQPRGLLLGGSDLLRQTERPPPPTHTHALHILKTPKDLKSQRLGGIVRTEPCTRPNFPVIQPIWVWRCAGPPPEAALETPESLLALRSILKRDYPPPTPNLPPEAGCVPFSLPSL